MSFLMLDGDKINLDASRFAVEKRMCELSFVEFIKQAWHVIEPGQEYLHNWHIDAIADHLTAITDELMIDEERYYNRILINVPPGAMKSLLCNVLWPSWEWGPRNMPYMRYVCASHAMPLAIRDSVKMRRLVSSEWYQTRWGDRVTITGDQNEKIKYETTATGFRQAVAFEGMTGARGDRVIIDDPHSVSSASSEQKRATTIETFEQAVPTRLNNPDKSAIVVIMQRLHEEDVSGIIIEKQLGYDHIMIPMEYDPDRAAPTMLGWEDPRTQKGELMFPDRFPRHVVDRDKRTMGTYAASGQFQQQPTPEDGGIIKRKHWQLWDQPMYPPFDYIIASLDTAYTEKTENDPSACTVWGIWTDDPKTHATRMMGRDGHLQQITRTFDEREVPPRIMLMHAWSEHLEMPELIRKISETCLRWKVSRLLIENKSVGMPVARELRRMYSGQNFGVQLEDPGSIDKMSRLYSVQHLFEEGLVYSPDKAWADEVISQCMRFPKAKHDDLVDTVSMAMRYLRRSGFILRPDEVQQDYEDSRQHTGRPPAPLYGI
jgi:predicted phage terminase large subunit-like protein